MQEGFNRANMREGYPVGISMRLSDGMTKKGAQDSGMKLIQISRSEGNFLS